jgi:integrase
MGRDLADGKVFPVSEAMILQIARSYGIGRKMGRAVIFSPEDRVRWITLTEANRFLEACSEHLRPLVLFLLYVGARCGEALWLDWSQVDLGRGHVTFPKTKNDARGVPLHPRVCAALANLPHREGRDVPPSRWPCV